MPNHPIPKTQTETLKDIIEGYYEAADAGESVEDEDVEDETEYSDDVISRQKKSSLQMLESLRRMDMIIRYLNQVIR